MPKRRLLWQLFPSYLFIMLLALVAVTWYASSTLKHHSMEQTADRLRIQALLSEEVLLPYIESRSIATIDSLCKDLGQRTETRYTVIGLDGTILGDTEEDPAHMDNHSDRPEVISALDSGYGSSTRFSFTVGHNMLYVALALKDGDVPVGVIRTSVPVTSLENALTDIYVKITIGGLIVAFIATLISLLISRRISRPITELRLGAERFANGDLTEKLRIHDENEIGELAETMNAMALQLHDRIDTVMRQSNEQQAVLSSMVEAVMAVDTRECLISINDAAAELFDVARDSVEGRILHEIVRNIDLQRFVADVLETRERQESDLIYHSQSLGKRYLQAHGSILRDSTGQGIGAVIVLNDLTHIKNLENIRRDFVANVSHEIRTPVTSIKGFVETLIEGAIDDPKHARRFLDIILRQADRLNAIIDDLLLLSRIEQESDRSELNTSLETIASIIRGAIEICEVKAAAKHITLSVNGDDALQVELNPALFEQVLINLIDNAIKYSNDGDTVEISYEQKNDEFKISITDQGPGIARKHIPRLFERFYRVDKARSRSLGGTGLGLAIVKHIVAAHGGRIEVESELNQGSTFSVYIPIPDRN